MPNPEFFEALKAKLHTGNAKTIHLNAVPGRLATRLDFDALRQIDQIKPQEFLDVLLSEEDFTFKISFEGIDLANLSPEREKPLQIIAKKLKSILSEHTDSFKEQGIRTFGFGYPLFIKRSNKNPKNVIKAPVFIWSLDIEKNNQAVNSWTVVKDSDKHTVVVNPLLRSFLINDEQLAMPDMPDDELTSSRTIIQYCAELLSRCNQQQSTIEYEHRLSDLWQEGIQPIPEKSVLENAALNTSARVINSGVFGLFRSPRQQILTELEHVIENQHKFQFERLVVAPFQGSSFSPVPTDPSQQHFLHQLGITTKQIIQGPPGTGKSQSITAIISNALLNGKKCLVVCEKKTAMGVILKNLHKLNPAIASLAALIEDIQGDRKSIVESVRSRADGIDGVQPNYQPKVHAQLESQSTELTQKINKAHVELTKTVAGIAPWTNAVGEYLRLQSPGSEQGHGELKRLFPTSLFEFKDGSKEMGDTAQKLKEAQELAAFTPNPNGHPLQMLSERLFTHESPVVAEDEIDTLIYKARPLLQQIGVTLRTVQSLIQSSSAASEAISQQKAISIATVPYQSFFMGQQLTEGLKLSETLTLETAIKEIWAKLRFLQTELEAISNRARIEITEHYESVAANIESALKHYYQQLEKHKSVFGEDIYSNGLGLRIKLALFKGFSKRLKGLLQAREDIRTNYEEVVHSFTASSYFQETAQQENEHQPANFESSVDALKQKVSAWRTAIDDKLEQHVSQLNRTSVPPLLKSLGDDVDGLIKSYISTIQTFSGELQLAENVPIAANNIPAIKSVIPQILIYVDGLAEGLKGFRTEYQERLQLLSTLRLQAEELVALWNRADCFNETLDSPSNLDMASRLLERSNHLIDSFSSTASSFKDFFRWKHFWRSCSERDKAIISALIEAQISREWSMVFTNWYWRTALSRADTFALPDSDTHINAFRETAQRLSLQQQASIIYKWKMAQKEAVWNFTHANPITLSQLYNLRGRNGERRNSLKQIIERDFELFTAFFPVVMVSPDTASSILPLKEGLFELVLFDEASQLRLEDTFTSLLRGQIKIVAGDKHQMPPSNAFQSTADTILLPSNDDDLDAEEAPDDEPVSSDQKALDRDANISLADSESLLTYAEDTGYERSYLQVHYRSEHPALIEFSNNAFYGRRLLPMPERFAYTPIRYVQVDGIYSEQTNRDEARQVISILANNIKLLPDGKYPTVMVATFNIQQRELIRELIDQRKAEDASFLTLMTNLGESFEVKNLENIQGDERDIFIISTTFGRKRDGKFSQMLGPISQGKGHRMLNVLVTRAKKQLFVCTSIPTEVINRHSSYIQVKGNTGNGIFYAYLAYARAIGSGDKQAAIAVLDILDRNCSDKPTDSKTEARADVGLSESVFEEEVYQRLVTAIGADRVQQQYPVGGFRIDIVVKPLNSHGRMLAIECDGAKYHSSKEAYAHDIFRQEQLEQMGFVFHRIWSSKWWRDTVGETSKLIAAIKANDAHELSDSLFSSAPKLDLLDAEIILVNEPLPPANNTPDMPPVDLSLSKPINGRRKTDYTPIGKQQKLSLESEIPTLFDTVTVAVRPVKTVQRNSIVTVRYENGVEKRIRFSTSRPNSSSLTDITVVKVDSPVAIALIGKKVGDVCSLPKMTVKVIDIE